MKYEEKFLKNSKQIPFGDIKTSFSIHPGSRDLMLLSEVDSIKQSILNIIKTMRYERPFQPLLACYLHDLLFDNMDDPTLGMARQMIFDAITVHEPRARVESIILSPSDDENGLYISITITVLNNSNPITIDVVLDRVR
jgi:phage baseplate assembly protein W